MSNGDPGYVLVPLVLNEESNKRKEMRETLCPLMIANKYRVSKKNVCLFDAL